MDHPTLFTIGHSNHPLPRLIEWLKKYEITLLADVRSSPWSRYNPQFNCTNLARDIEAHGIAYLFLGQELGGRTDDPDCLEDDGRIRYDKVAEKPQFKHGLERLLDEAKRFEIALMCAEKEPLHCHRTLLVSHALAKGGTKIVHVLADGSTETHEETMERLLRMIHDTPPGKRSNRQPSLDLFSNEQGSPMPADPAASERSRSVEEAISVQTRRWGFKKNSKK